MEYLIKLVISKPVSLKHLHHFGFSRIHRLEIQTSSLHDAGDYTFVPEGYSQSLSAKIHIIGIQKRSDIATNLVSLHHNHNNNMIMMFLYRPTKGTSGQLELPRQHSYNCGRKQTTTGDPHQWRTSTQGGVDERRKGEI